MTLTQRITTKPGYRLLLIAALIAGGMTVDYRTNVKIDSTPIVIPEPAKHMELADYFDRKGSPHPERMATAVLETKKPRLLAAIAAVESSGGKETAVNKRSKAKGAFQVKQKHWGRVPNDVVEQALQADRILNDLYDENDGNLRKTLNAYGGSKDGKYARLVLSELQNVPR